MKKNTRRKQPPDGQETYTDTQSEKKKGRGRSLARIGYSFFKKIVADQLDVYCAQSCFFLLMSLVPMMMIVLMFLQWTPYFSEEEILAAFETFVNADVMDTVENVVASLYHGSMTGMLMTVFTIFFMSGRGILGISKGLNRINGVRENRNYFYLRLRSTAYTVVLLGTFLLSMLMIVYSVRAGAIVTDLFPFIHISSPTMRIIAAMIVAVMLLSMFLVLYTFLPNERKSMRSQLPGAIFSVISWGVFSLFFLLYLNLSQHLSVIYGGLLTIVMGMMWLYWCMYLFLIGAEINAYLKDPDSFPF